MAKILVVDDEKLIVKGIRFSLMQDGYEVDCAYDGKEALELAKATAYDMILLDVMLPEMDGFEVCQQIREFSDVPIIMLTAKGEDMDKILGLDYGADDYITKPFNILEVKARIKAIMRRTDAVRKASEKKAAEDQKNSSILENGDLKLDCDNRRLYVEGREVNLTSKEFEVLELLVRNPGGYMAVRSCWMTSGAAISRAMSGPWTCTSGDCVKRSKPIRPSPSTCRQNGASATISEIRSEIRFECRLACYDDQDGFCRIITGEGCQNIFRIIPGRRWCGRTGPVLTVRGTLPLTMTASA
jgi:two-component system response regulator VicR